MGAEKHTQELHSFVKDFKAKALVRNTQVRKSLLGNPPSTWTAGPLSPHKATTLLARMAITSLHSFFFFFDLCQILFAVCISGLFIFKEITLYACNQSPPHLPPDPSPFPSP